MHDLQGSDVSKEIIKIWEFEPSYVLYGGYINMDIEETDELWEELTGLYYSRFLYKIINSVYKQTNGFRKGYLAINASDIVMN